MISFDRYLAILGQSDRAVQQAAGHAFQRLLALVRQGQAPRSAIDQIMREFNAETLTGFREAFSAVLESSLGEKDLKAWPVGGVKLSQRLYQNAQQVSATAKAMIEQHLKGLHNAQELRKALYEGYNFQEDPLDIIKPLPKYLQVEFDRFKAAQLKTPALRAAYLAAINAQAAGEGQERIKRQLQVAFYERNRYFANRIARTELHRAYTDQQAREWMGADWVEYVQIRLSSKHPKTDICDLHAKLDAYGLGAGVYPKADAPKPPFHPHCYCVLSPKIDLINPRPRFNPKAERTWLESLDPKEAAKVAGSYEKRRRILKDGESMESIYNEGKDELYRWKRVGDVTGNTKTIKAASGKTPAEFVRGCRDAPKDKQSPLSVGLLESTVIAQVSALGIRVKGEQVALDHDYTRHTLLHHGGETERNRGQIPITDEDLALAAAILNQSQKIKLGAPPKSKNGAWRLEVVEEVGAYRYTVVYEVRRAGVVVFTMFKHPK